MQRLLLAAVLLPLTVLSTGNMTALATPTTSSRLEDQLEVAGGICAKRRCH